MDEVPGPEQDDQRATWVDHALYTAFGCLLAALLIASLDPVAKLQALFDALPRGSATETRLPGALQAGNNAAWNAYAAAYNRAHQLTKDGKYAEALPHIESACGMDTTALPADARSSGHLLHGTILGELKRYDQALIAVERARGLTSGAQVYESLCSLHFKREDYRQAVAYGRDYLDSGGKPSPYIYVVLAMSHDRLGDVEQASNWIGRGRADFPQDADLARLGTRYDRQAQSERGMSTQHGGRFILKFVEVREQAHVRDRCLRALDAAYSNACATFAYQPREALPVILYPSSGAYYNASGAPQWSGAQYDGKIRIPLSDRMDSGLDAVIAHEMTHYVVHQVAGTAVPAWLDEGLAQLAERRDDAWAHAEISRASRLYSLAELNEPFARLGSAGQARLAYAQALVTTRRLVDQVGMPRMRGILDQLASGRGIEEIVDIR